MRWSGYIAAGAFSVVASSAANAQTVPALPGTVQPGAVERSLQQQLPMVAPDTVSIPAPQGLEAPAGSENFHFLLRGVNIVGAHAVPASDLQSSYRSFLGRDVTLADIYAIARAITDLYTRHGYAISFAIVPAQEIDESKGEIRIDVIEGYVGKLDYSGQVPNVARLYGDTILQSQPLRTADIERSLLLINDLPGVQAHSIFEHLDNAPTGDTGLAVDVHEQPVTGTAFIDNRGSKAFGPWRASLNASFNSLLGQGESISFTGVHALNSDELNYGAVKTFLPLGGDGWTFSTNTTYTSAHPGTPLLTSAGLTSSGWTTQASVNDPVLRGRLNSLWLWGGVSADWLNSDLFTTPNSEDHIYSLQAGLIWNVRDALGATALDATLNQGLHIFDSTTSSSPLRSRANGNGTFTSFDADVTRVQNLAYGFGLFFAGKVQLAARGLLVPNQCGYGGGVIGHGFDDNEIMGDHCVEGLAELHYTAEQPSIGGTVFTQLQPFITYDAGAVWNDGPVLPHSYGSATGDSAGAGIRAELFNKANVSLEYDQPMGRNVALEGNRNGRLFFFASVTW